MVCRRRGRHRRPRPDERHRPRDVRAGLHHDPRHARRSAGSPNEGTNGFTDVPADQWYTQAVAWAAQNGIVNGVGNNKFDPDAKITREQLAAVLYRYAGKVGMDVTARADLKLFPDAGSVSAYATDALSWCVANGIVNGTLEHGTAYLDPQGSATRAQVATLMSRYLKLTEA